MSDHPLNFSDRHKRWYRQTWNPNTEQWETLWLPEDCQPAQTPPEAQPQAHKRKDSVTYHHGSGGIASDATAGVPGSSSNPAAHYPSQQYPLTGQERAQSQSGSETSVNLPRGQGGRIAGTYNRKQGGPTAEKVDPSFKVRHKKFFVEGRVFAVIMAEPAGEQAATDYNTSLSGARNITPVKYKDNLMFTQTRRFIVVRQRREFCFACPIFTYGGRATTKRGLRAREHGIAYSTGQEPRLVENEGGMIKPSLEVKMNPGEPCLDMASRIYYGIHHPIQYNVKVKNIGRVIDSHVPALIASWKSESEDGISRVNEEDGDDSSGENQPPEHSDPFLYDPDTNTWGYDSMINPHMYHPQHNPCGYHPLHNLGGYHPESNPYSYHPEHNAYGYHPTRAPFCYHPTYSPHGYHYAMNRRGYHPSIASYNYHPKSNPYGFHEELNAYGFHPKDNPSGYHPRESADAYHPEYNPSGVHESSDDSGEEEEEEEEEEEDDDDDDDEDPPVIT